MVGQIPLETCTIDSVTTSPFAGGIGQYITFHGTNFGDGIKGEVIVPNADDGGLTGLLIGGIDYWNNQTFFTEWSDTEVTMNISSKINGFSTGPFGSGSWTIDPDFTSQTTSLPCHVKVEIKYNLRSAILNNEIKMIGHARFDTENPNGSIGWFIQDGIDSNSHLDSLGIKFNDVFDVADQAFCDWETQTGIHFEYQGVTNAGKNSSDGKFVLFFDTLPINVLMRTSNQSKLTCNENDLFFAGRLFDSDIAINNNEKWFINTSINGITGDQFDFYSVLMHEIGHMLQLNHVMDTLDNTSTNDYSMMYWAFPPNTMKRSVDTNSINGIVLLRDRIIQALTPGECFNGYLFNTLPPSCPILVETSSITFDYFLSIQNPVRIGNKIKIFGLENIPNHEIINATLFDAFGKPLQQLTDIVKQKFYTEKLVSGIYFIRMESNKGAVTKKVIIIK